MFKLHSISRLGRRSGLVLLLAISLVLAMLPTVAMAAPLNGMHENGMHEGMRGNSNCVSYRAVQRGETLSGIAMYAGVSIWALKDANGIGDPNRIYAGEWLCIPGYGHDMGHDMGHGMGHNVGYGAGHPDQGHYANSYTVCAGDSLSSIAMHFGTSVWWLLQVNHISNPNHIYAGQVLRVG